MTSSHHGLLVIDKPGGMTSRAAVDRAQGWFPRGTRLGHTGTLDPLATGVLVLCVGAATRLGEYVQRMEKVYRAGIRLSARSDTDDADGAVTPVAVTTPPGREHVEEVLRGFIGEIEQVPPAYSAAKVTGRRAYALARRGDDVQLAPRKVEVYEITLLAYDYPLLDVEVRCGKGTYIRSLARDLGERLGCGGLIQTLRRARVGRFSMDDAVSLDAEADTARRRLLPLAAAVTELPRITLNASEVGALVRGQCVPVTEAFASGEAAACDAAGQLVAVVAVEGGNARPLKVLIQ
jgi:tRNA pseudouridine55 synthase